MPKGVLWRQHDIFLSSMGGRPWGSDQALASYDELAEKARASPGAMSILMIPPFMHGAAQWAAFTMVTMGGRLVIPDDVERMRRRRGAAAGRARAGAQHPRRRRRDRPSAASTRSRRATTTCRVSSRSPTAARRCRRRCGSGILAALPNVMVHGRRRGLRVRRADEHRQHRGRRGEAAIFTPQSDTAVVSADLDRVLRARRGPGLAGPARPDPARLPRRRREDRPHLPDDRRRAVVGAGRSGKRVGRRPNRTARPRLGDHQLRRREDLRRGGRARRRRSSQRVRRRRGRAARPSAGAARSWPSCSSPTARAPTDEELVEACARVDRALQDPEGVHPHRRRSCAHPRARPTTAGPRKLADRGRQVRVAGEERGRSGAGRSRPDRPVRRDPRRAARAP